MRNSDTLSVTKPGFALAVIHVRIGRIAVSCRNFSMLPTIWNVTMRLHPALPEARPLVIAHRSGNELHEARAAYEAGADMIETDIWRRSEEHV